MIVNLKVNGVDETLNKIEKAKELINEAEKMLWSARTEIKMEVEDVAKSIEQKQEI